MNTVNPANSISGYKVIYQSSATHKLITKYYSRPSFTLPLNKNTFYQVRIYPYLLLNNKRYVTTTPTTRYISMGIVLQKAGNTNSTMPVFNVTGERLSHMDMAPGQLQPFGLSDKPLSIEGEVSRPTHLSPAKQYRLFFQPQYLQPRRPIR